MLNKKPGEILKKTFLSLPAAIILAVLCFSLFSCENARSFSGSLFKPGGTINTSADIASKNNQDGEPERDETVSPAETPIYLFDYTEVEIEPTQSIDIWIKNCNIYVDIYGDLIILGEFENLSLSWKTSIEITYDFYDSAGQKIDTVISGALANYLQPGSRMPFTLVYDARANYIKISRIKIGVNFKNYNKSLKGFPVVAEESQVIKENILQVKGEVTNLGESDIEDLKLFGTFYNFKNQAVFIKECYIKNDTLAALAVQDFELMIMFDEYLQDFTHYRIEAYFRDALKLTNA